MDIFSRLSLIILVSCVYQEIAPETPIPEPPVIPLNGELCIVKEVTLEDIAFCAIPQIRARSHARPLDPFLVWEYSEAFAWAQRALKEPLETTLSLSAHETRIQHWIVGLNEEYGLIQAMCKKGRCRATCFNPKTLREDYYLQLEIGIQELKYWRRWHKRSCNPDHGWIGHYNWGYRIFHEGHHAGYPRRVKRWQQSAKRVLKNCKKQLTKSYSLQAEQF